MKGILSPAKSTIHSKQGFASCQAAIPFTYWEIARPIGTTKQDNYTHDDMYLQKGVSSVGKQRAQLKLNSLDAHQSLMRALLRKNRDKGITARTGEVRVSRAQPWPCDNMASLIEAGFASETLS